ncbi:MAG: cellulose biosynthesis protein BcsG [Pseudomonadota bacterium]
MTLPTEQKLAADEYGAKRTASISLGAWSFYFLAKLGLFWNELIGFHALENLAFAAFILLPAKTPLGQIVKEAATALFAIMLLYYDSWLPPIGRVFSQASLVSGFSFDYLVELLGRFINLPIIATLIIAWAVYWYISRWVRTGVIVVAAMVVMVITQNPVTRPAAQFAETIEPATGGAAGGKPDMDQMLQAFFAGEAARSVSFPAPQAGDAPFDVIFLQVCSLSWDDIRATGLDHHPLWHRFDFLLNHFNSAASYSGPAVIRILRSTCGQSPHAKLYSPAPDPCYLMGSLQRGGFETALAMNHDGHFDDFLPTVQAQAGMNVPPFPLNSVAVTQHAFDGSPIYDDFSLLTRWLDHRQKSSNPRVALFYNTVSLHDGNRLSGANAAMNSSENYKIRLTRLLDDLQRFMESLEKSGRRAVVAMIPEHGAAVRGDKMQIAGLREIPSPAITLVPVGIKVIGGNIQRDGDTLSIDMPTSYLAVSHIIARLLEKNPYAGSRFSPADYVTDLPGTPLVSQNGEVAVMSRQGRYYLRQDASGWVEYSD